MVDITLYVFVVIFALILWLTYYISLRIFRRKNEKQKLIKRISFWSTFIVIAFVLYLFFVFGLNGIEESVRRQNFNKETWLQDINGRYPYADFLIENKKLDRLTKSEIIDLLGNPDFESGNVLTYNIGSPYFEFSLDNYWLEIILDNQTNELRVYK